MHALQPASLDDMNPVGRAFELWVRMRIATVGGGVGQTITVSFRLGMEQLGFWDTEANLARFVVEPGTFGLCIGASLLATHELTFEVS